MIRTIIVDDELLAGVGVRSLIDEKEDIRVLGVFSMPEEAVEFLRENIVDVVITDIEMADMNGLEFIQIIREENLADGIIILSCHDEFAYAQKAISQGIDSYLLKHNISSEILIKEIHKIQEKGRYHGQVRATGEKKEKSISVDVIYMVCVLRFCSNESVQNYEERPIERTMLMHLMERIVDQYEMGTLFAPYNQEMFIVFQDDKKKDIKERQEMIYANITAFEQAVRQYIDGRILYGLSTEFEDLKQMRDKYDEALHAIEMSFYKPEKQIFTFHKPLSVFSQSSFTAEYFFEDNGMDIFKAELNSYLKNAEQAQYEIRELQGRLIQEVNKMVYHILKEYLFGETLIQKWGSNVMLFSIITQEKDVTGLKEKLIQVMEQFRSECLAEIAEDSLSEVVDYIENHLEERLSLAELAEQACMSIPTFSKRFKERTNMTLVQYLNERRIERASLLMKNKQLSLEEIAEKSGFSNANYLVRVFKKVTGKTVSEYRK